MTHARLVLLSVLLCSSPSLQTLSQHSFILDLPHPASLRSQPKATGEIACFQTVEQEEVSSLVRGPSLFASSSSAEQLPQSPCRSCGGSAVEERAGSGGSGDLQLTWFVLPFPLNQPQREGRDFYK